MDDRYELTNTYVFEDDNHKSIINVFSPIISDQERERRMMEIKNAACLLMMELYKVKSEK